MSNELKLQVPDSIIEAHIGAAVSSALGGEGKDELIRAFVETVVKATSRDPHSYRDEPTWKLLFRKQVEEKVKELIKEIVGERSEEIGKQLRKTLTTKRIVDTMADCLVDGLKSASWTTRVSFEPKGGDR